jgi:hypothetical protein
MAWLLLVTRAGAPSDGWTENLVWTENLEWAEN